MKLRTSIVSALSVLALLAPHSLLAQNLTNELVFDNSTFVDEVANATVVDVNETHVDANITVSGRNRLRDRLNRTREGRNRSGDQGGTSTTVVPQAASNNSLTQSSSLKNEAKQNADNPVDKGAIAGFSVGVAIGAVVTVLSCATALQSKDVAQQIYAGLWIAVGLALTTGCSVGVARTAQGYYHSSY